MLLRVLVRGWARPAPSTHACAHASTRSRGRTAARTHARTQTKLREHGLRTTTQWANNRLEVAGEREAAAMGAMGQGYMAVQMQPVQGYHGAPLPAAAPDAQGLAAADSLKYKVD